MEFGESLNSSHSYFINSSHSYYLNSSNSWNNASLITTQTNREFETYDNQTNITFDVYKIFFTLHHLEAAWTFLATLW